MRPPALERHGPAIPDITCSTFKAAFHNAGGICKGHAFRKPADLRRMDPKDREHHKARLPYQPGNTKGFVKDLS